MRLNHQTVLTLDNMKEYVTIPYMKTKEMEKGWLQTLVPPSFYPLVEPFIGEEGKRLIQFEGKWIEVEFLPIERKHSSFLEDLKSVLGAWSKQSNQSSTMLLEHLEVEGFTKAEWLQVAVTALVEGAYIFNKSVLTQVKTENIFEMRDALTGEKEEVTLTLIIEEEYKEIIEKALVYGKAINKARTLANLPNNYLHIGDFVSYAKSLANYYGLGFKTLGKAKLEELQSGGILGVNAGSSEEAQLVVLDYKGSESETCHGLVGKGVMFDAGGYHLKSIEGMDGMKYDMCGAANVLGVIEILAALKVKTNVKVVIPVVENVISPDALKMGDVITTMSGKTVEVWNTDAEGRLILCDALTYALREGVTDLIDLATLTYSCQNALGTEISGVFTNDESFYEEFMAHVKRTGEKIWRLPLDAIYHEQLKTSKVADLMNYAPGYGAAASVAACFLENFVEQNVPWMHFDVVGTAVCRSERKDKEKGATGVCIGVIASFLEQ